MIVLIQKFLFIITIGVALSLTGCSSMYYERSQARSLPKLPEVSRPSVARAKVVHPAKRAVVTRPRPLTAKVSKYPTRKGQITSVVNTQRKKASLNVEKTEEKSEQVDPYATIPESNTSEVSITTAPKPSVLTSKSSPAVKSLLIRAQADLAIGQTTSAVSKLERALRIEPQNAKLWNLLAKAHYDQSDYQQSIAMAKKSIRYSNNDDLIAKSWALIKKAGLKSGDTVVIKEANNYIKLNP